MSSSRKQFNTVSFSDGPIKDQLDFLLNCVAQNRDNTIKLESAIDALQLRIARLEATIDDVFGDDDNEL